MQGGFGEFSKLVSEAFQGAQALAAAYNSKLRGSKMHDIERCSVKGRENKVDLMQYPHRIYLLKLNKRFA